jgi:hypothetical protein
LPRALNAVHDRHADVHQDHVGAQQAGSLDGLAPVGGFPHHVQPGLRLEDEPQAAPHERLVVGEQDRGHWRPGSSGTVARTAKTASTGDPRILAHFTRPRMPNGQDN